MLTTILCFLLSVLTFGYTNDISECSCEKPIEVVTDDGTNSSGQDILIVDTILL